MEADDGRKKEQDRRVGVVLSIAIHVILFALFLYPIFSYQDPPPELEGVLVSFGEPNIGSGNDRPATQNQERVEKSTPPEAQQPKEVNVPEEVDVKVENKAPKEEKKLTSEDEAAIALEKQRQQEAQEQARKKAEAEAAKQKAAQEEARRQQEYQDAKKQFGDVFGEGKGKTDVAGNQGDPGGDPDSKVLEGISTGSGVVGGGLGTRGVKSEPKIQDRSQKSGRVVVNVCVDSSGKVVSAEYTQRGSTTTDRELRDIAIKNAKLFHFTESNVEKQCGTITINFQLE